jgi:hypothetical protein
VREIEAGNVHARLTHTAQRFLIRAGRAYGTNDLGFAHIYFLSRAVIIGHQPCYFGFFRQPIFYHGRAYLSSKKPFQKAENTANILVKYGVLNKKRKWLYHLRFLCSPVCSVMTVQHKAVLDLTIGQ